MSKNASIGIFDAGVGGLSVARSVRAALPCEDIIYLADSINAPYGAKSVEFIQTRAFKISEFLIQHDVKMIVVACNTATVSTVKMLRHKFNIPIVGAEPGVKPAVSKTKSGKVCVMATTRTVESASLSDLIQRYSGETKIIPQACPGLVELIEDMKHETSEMHDFLENLTAPLIAQDVDTFVMGCTHYAFIVPMLRKIVGDNINIITTHDAIAKQVVHRLAVDGLTSDEADLGQEVFWTNKKALIESKLIDKLWGKAVSVKLLSNSV